MESKRENFRKYLEGGNVMDSLTKALVSLYEEPERPKDPLNYIRQALGSAEGVDVDSIVRENQELKGKIASLTQDIKTIQEQQEKAAQNA